MGVTKVLILMQGPRDSARPLEQSRVELCLLSLRCYLNPTMSSILVECLLRVGLLVLVNFSFHCYKIPHLCSVMKN